MLAGTVSLTEVFNSFALLTPLRLANISLTGLTMLTMVIMMMMMILMILIILSTTCRSPRNFDAVLGLYRTNKLHLAAGVCVQVKTRKNLFFNIELWEIYDYQQLCTGLLWGTWVLGPWWSSHGWIAFHLYHHHHIIDWLASARKWYCI